ncbi:MAG TPA: ABC transporter ATP-binding protein [Syntrophales bacterium]|nr:ABC transporter ATP-binding protein [Syntrophales bacterium]
MESVIEAANLQKTFDGIKAVDGVSFRVLRGECFGILGPNGAGKTSTIRMIYGFSPMTGGSLDVFGLDIRTDWRTIRSKIGVCQQDNNLDPELTVLENLFVFARYFDVRRKDALGRARRYLAFMALDHRRESQVLELSGGMLRRLMIVRALINEPDLLILDEPTTGLDPQSRHQVWERLEELRSRGLSILLTTHYMDEASRLCDRLIIMDHGRILVEGNPADLIREHAGKEIIEIPNPRHEIRELVREKMPDYEDLGHRLVIYLDEREKSFQEIRSYLRAEGCIMRMATLEDVFLRLTGRDLRE